MKLLVPTKRVVDFNVKVRVKPDGSGVRWIAVDGDSNVEVDIDPDTNVWQRLRLMLMYLLVPEGQL